MLKYLESEKSKTDKLRCILGPKESYGSSKGLSYDLQSERTRISSQNVPDDFIMHDWLALSRTTKFPDNANGLGNARLSKGCYEIYRIQQKLHAILRKEEDCFEVDKQRIKIMKNELSLCDVDYPDFVNLQTHLSNMTRSYLAAKNNLIETRRIYKNAMDWAIENFKKTTKIKEFQNYEVVVNFIDNVCYANLIKVIAAAVFAHEGTEKELDLQYNINSFKRKHGGGNAEHTDNEEDIPLRRKYKNNHPHRNEDVFMTQLREQTFVCPGVPGCQCPYNGQSLRKDQFQHDHIHAWRFSKDDRPQNKRPLCYSCHAHKTKFVDNLVAKDTQAIQMLQIHNKLPHYIISAIREEIEKQKTKYCCEVVCQA